jgi:putative ABC transport system permease protein
MLKRDILFLTLSSLISHRLRSFLTSLGVSIGIAAVILLTSIGEGLHQFILSEFTQFGTTIIGINPGKTTTMGMAVGVFGSERPLTIQDVEALKRQSYTKSVVGLIQGNAEVEGNHRSRRTTIYGTTTAFPQTFKMPVKTGQFLPDDDPLAPRALAVLGHSIQKHLFNQKNPIGERIRIGGERYRVIGVMQAKGEILGIDLDDSIYIPLARGLDMFNRDGLVEIDLEYRQGYDETKVVNAIRHLLTTRHGREDFTITTQQQMLDVLADIIKVITFAVGAIGAISLLVGGIGIITIMTISVSERQSEIGLLRALGASKGQILVLFLGEATILSAIGGLVGLSMGIGIGQFLTWVFPVLPVHIPWGFVLTAEITAIVIGLAAGVIPAQTAAAMNPVDALRSE